jgi:NADPH-dependent 2,4-dienoyl-CoA reductase/sulfur reductase-like enzyme/rhodanese-related sulfurtransferase
MERSDFVIIGGVAAGPKTAATLARRMPGARITLFQRDARLSFARCGLPYFASGDINSIEELMRTPYGVTRDADFFTATKGFRAFTGTEVTRIDRAAKTITARKVTDGETFQHGYGKLVLATGATACPAPFHVPAAPNIRVFQDLDDALAFRQSAEQGRIDRALIVGAGPIGCEVAEAVGGLWGIACVLVEREAQPLPGFLDPEMGALVRRELERQGIEVILGASAQDLALGADDKPVLRLVDGRSVEADYAVLALGVRPEVDLARQSGLRIGPTGGIAVNERMQTSDPDVFAGGDCVESRHRLTDQPVFVALGSLANRHGRIIAENLAGGEARYPGVLGTLILKIFDANVGRVGLSEREAAEAGLETDAVWGAFHDKPEYYPEAKTFVLKMVYERKSERLLGLQAVGAGDVCRRIDVFAAFLQNGARVGDLFDFEHGYAPPYAEALDPLHQMAGIARAQSRGVELVRPEIALEDDRDNHLLVLDVRERKEAEGRPLPERLTPARAEVVNVPLNELASRRQTLDRGARIVVVCQRGPRAYQAALMLKANGFERAGFLAGGLELQAERQREEAK